MDRNSIRKTLNDELAAVDAEIRSLEAQSAEAIAFAGAHAREARRLYEEAKGKHDALEATRRESAERLALRRDDVLSRIQAFEANTAIGAPRPGTRTISTPKRRTKA